MWWKMLCPCYETFQTSLKLLKNKRQEEKERTMSPDNEVLPLCFICRTAQFEKSGSHFIWTEHKCSAWNSPKWINSLPIIFKWRKINRIGAWGRIIGCRVCVCVCVCVCVFALSKTIGIILDIIISFFFPSFFPSFFLLFIITFLMCYAAFCLSLLENSSRFISPKRPLLTICSC